jgi:hypothetical protein
MAMCLRELIEFHEDFIKMILQRTGELRPQMIYELDGKTVATAFIEDFRTGILQVLDMLRGKPISWLITMNEGYEDSLKYIGRDKDKLDEVLDKYVPGSLQKRFESGDKTVKEVILMNVYTKYVKLSITYDKDMKKLRQTDSFGGLLAVDDLDRLSWASSGLEGQVD